MASPTPGTGTFTGQGTNSTTWVPTLTSRNSGDLLLLSIFQDGSVAPTTPGGWEQVFSGLANGSAARLTILGRITDAAEGATINVTMPSESGGIYCHTITGHGCTNGNIATEILESTNASGASVSPDPTAVTISTSKDYLFMAVYAQDTGSPRASAYPTNYGTGQVTNGLGGTTGASGAIAFRALTTGSNEDPSTFTSNTNEDWSAVVLAIPPVAAVAAVPYNRHYLQALLAQ